MTSSMEWGWKGVLDVPVVSLCFSVSARASRGAFGDPPWLSLAQKVHCQDEVQGRRLRGVTGKEETLGGLEKAAGTQRDGKEGMLFTSSALSFLHEQQQNAAWHRFVPWGERNPEPGAELLCPTFSELLKCRK